ncbi:uncharacterized protein LOC110230113 [Arabidopsis lyrata subsp. lyrata]|nr:uncharacterized protein LOC110230113 [Arabidopsis lyrata subsp. lyrata]|eukprot:XP_020887785.1 uncharacterized protein LOC110230113 [Arabidopsis lyrata subsp. lyrata]
MMTLAIDLGMLGHGLAGQILGRADGGLDLDMGMEKTN